VPELRSLSWDGPITPEISIRAKICFQELEGLREMRPETVRWGNRDPFTPL